MIASLLCPIVFSQSRPAVAALAPHKGVALVIGCGRYTDPQWPKLHTDNDVDALAGSLELQGYAVRTAKTPAETTKRAILEDLRVTLETIKPHAPVWVHFSGRGVREPDPAHDSAITTFLLPSDATFSGGMPQTSNASLSDSLAAGLAAVIHGGVPAISQLLPAEAFGDFARAALNKGASHVYFSFDACYSGGLDLGESPNIVCFYSSAPTAESYEFGSPQTGAAYGGFSYALARRIARIRPGESCGELMGEVKANTPTKSPPMLAGSATTPLETSPPIDSGRIPVVRSGKTCMLLRGEGQGILDTYIFQLSDAGGNAVADAFPAVVLPNRTILNATRDSLPTGKLFARLKGIVKSFALPRVDASRVRDCPFGASVATSAVDLDLPDGMRDHNLLDLVLDYPRVSGAVLNRYIVNLQLPDGSVLATFDASKPLGETQYSSLVSYVVNWQNRQALDALEPDINAPLEVQAVRVSTSAKFTNMREPVLSIGAPLPSTGVPVSVAPGDSFAVRVRLRPGFVSKPLYVQALDLHPNLGIDLLWPNSASPSESDKLVPDGNWRYFGRNGKLCLGSNPVELATWRLNANQGAGPEVIKVFAINRAISFMPFFHPPKSLPWSMQFPPMDLSPATWTTASFTMTLRPLKELFVPSETQLIGIGLNQYKLSSLTLPNCVSDIQSVGATLQKSVPSLHSSALVNAMATSDGVVKFIHAQTDRESKDDLNFLYFSGHARFDPLTRSTSLALYDWDGQGSGGLTLSQLKQLVLSTPARHQIVCLDACDTATTDGKSLARLFGDGMFPGEGTLLLGVRGQALDSKSSGVLTAAVVAALRDPSSDENGDGWISAAELAHAVSRRQSNPKGARESFYAELLGDDFAVAHATVRTSHAAVQLRWMTKDPIQQAQTRAVDATKPDDSKAYHRHGKDYALLIAVDDYGPGFNKLNNPIHDAELLKETLESVFHFSTTLLKNPTRDRISAELDAYDDPTRCPLTGDDQLLVFFAGHGLYIPPPQNEGFLVPHDGIYEEVPARKPDGTMGKRVSDAACNSFVNFTRFAKRIDALNFKHELIILDACTAGKLSDALKAHPRGADPGLAAAAPFGSEEEKQEFIAHKMSLPSRLVLCSGDGVVDDGPPGRGSPFANALHSLIEGAYERGFLTFEDMVNSVQYMKPAPVPATILDYDQGGSFLFLRPRRQPGG